MKPKERTSIQILYCVHSRVLCVTLSAVDNCREEVIYKGVVNEDHRDEVACK